MNSEISNVIDMNKRDLENFSKVELIKMVKNMGLLVQFSTTFTSHSSAHNSHSAPEPLSLSNCIKLWGKLVLMQYDTNIWC